MNILFNTNYRNNYNNHNNLPKPQISFTALVDRIPLAELQGLLEQGVSCGKIGQIYGVSDSIVRYVAEKNGFKTNTKKATELLNQKMPIYLKLKYGLRKIVQETKLPSDRINRWIERNLKEKPKEFFNREKQNLLLSDLSNAEVAKKLGIDPIQVKNLRREIGNVVKDFAKRKRFNQVIRHWKMGLESKEIAEKFKISKATINRYIREYKKSIQAETP